MPDPASGLRGAAGVVTTADALLRHERFAVDHMTTSDLNKDGKTDTVATSGNDVVVLLGLTGQ